MAKVSAYPEVTQPSPTGWLFIAERQPDGSFVTKKVAPENIGLQGPVGPQGAAGTPGATGAAGTPGATGAAGTPGATGAAGTPGTNGLPGVNGTNGAPGAPGAPGATGATGAGYFTYDGIVFDNFEDYSAGSISTMDKGIGWRDNGSCTGATIVTKTKAGNGTSMTEKRLSLDNGEYIRKLPWGDGWNRIEVFIQFRVGGLAAAAFTGLGYVGICSGQTNTSSSATCDNFIGLGFNKGVNGWTFNSGTLVDYTGYATNQTFLSRRVNTDTGFGGVSGTDGRAYSATEGFVSILHFAFSRPVFANDATVVNYSGGVASTTVTQVEMKKSKTDIWAFLHAVELAAVGTTANATIGAGTATAPLYPFDQSTGKLDTLNLYWPVAGKQFEIAAIGVRKVY